MAQKCEFQDPPAPPALLGGAGGGGQRESQNGWSMTPHGMVRVLLIFAEVNYTGTVSDPTGPTGTLGWPAHQLPTWANNAIPALNLFDHTTPQGAQFTQYYQQASSGDFTVLGDYLVAPGTNPLFQVNSTTGTVTASDAFNAVNLALGTTISTGHLYTSIDDFDRWTIGDEYDPITGPGFSKVNPSTENPRKFDHVMIIWRNSMGNNGTGFAIPFPPPSTTLLGRGINGYSMFGAYNSMPLNIARHEFGHLLYGRNNFHTGGGGWPETPIGNTGYWTNNYGQYWIAQSSGWSNMGLYNCSLLSWNAWDRQRMGWKANDQTFEISARKPDMTEDNGDLDATNQADAGTYLLRDFVSSGDAIRIKLPFTDPVNEYPEFLWVENHQGANQNTNPYDRWQHESPGEPCVIPVVPGLQMYVQIDKEVRQNSDYDLLYGGPGDYLRPLDANGHVDDIIYSTTENTTCVCGGCPRKPYLRSQPNPLTGVADRHGESLDINGNGALIHSDVVDHWIEDQNGTSVNELFNLGHARQVFTANAKVGIGTNPSSATMMNSVGFDVNRPGTKNLRRIYLNGVSVELMAQHTDGSIEVKVRFDDVDVKNDARWCADEIQLNPVATSTGYSLNVTAGNTITLDRGTTATRRNNPETYNGQQVFNSATLMRCPANTWLNLAPGGGFVVDNGSTLRLESGSRMDIGNGAVLRVKRGGKLELMGGSVLNVLPGGQVIIEEDVVNGNDGHLLFYPNARINKEASNSVLEIAGMLDIQDNATFTTSRSGDPSTTYGLVKFTNTDQPSYNVTAGMNTRFILRSTGSNNRILHVQQESLYGPTTLVEFSLLTGKATLADNARIVPPVTNAATVKFINAIVTSNTGLRNTHRGVRLNGQALLMLSNSTFSKGNYGVYSYNSTLGNSPVPQFCSFLDCNTGMYNYDKGIKAISCKFDKCTDGLVCVQMAHTSYLNDCSAQKNAQTGVSFQGSSTLNVTNPAFNYNTIGLSIGGATAVVACGSVSLNKRCGFLVHHGGTLRMDDNHTGHDPVTAVKNGTSILCQQANNVYLDLGLNSLKPMVTGAQNSLFGTFLCQPYSITQPARKNNWNGTVGTPLTSADYSITTCGAPLQFVDPASTPEYTCGQIPLSVPAGSSELAGPPVPGLMDNCSGCAAVMSADSVLMPLNQASLDALELGYNDSLPNNELLAIGAFHALLANPVAAPNYYEKFLLAYDHGLMVESFGDALKKGQLNPTTDNAGMATHLGWMTAVEDARMDAAQPGEQDDFIFYTSLERAQLTRAAGQLDDAVAQLEGIAQPPAPDEQELLARILCYTQTERSLANGTCTWDDVEGIMLACTGQGGTKILMQTPASGPEDSSMAQPGLQPNPATTEVLVRGFGDEECLLRLMDITGRVVIQEVRFTGKTRLPLADVQPGTYVCLITTSKGHLWQGKMMVGR
jgi:hypothetical protein